MSPELSPSSTGIFHHPFALFSRLLSGTTTEQALCTILAIARCNGRWNDNESPPNGECGTLSQSPMTAPLVGPAIVPDAFEAARYCRSFPSVRNALSIRSSWASVMLTFVAQARATAVLPRFKFDGDGSEVAASCEADTCNVLRCRASTCDMSMALLPPPGGTGRPVSSMPSRYNQSLSSRSRALKTLPMASRMVTRWEPSSETGASVALVLLVGLSASASSVPAKFKLNPNASSHRFCSYSTCPADIFLFCGSIPCAKRSNRAQHVAKVSASSARDICKDP
mmetsp:Transcript_26458/g.74019  ORF Transcript_26458/g.74019 Transcript_26458/m.74019 type:complete len:282 (-) Transcript_26458:3693-4538(-)